ncbi:MAG: tRNA (adenosine(37)-N6)-threonylcarbamoyltransferase complex dimerization subunit type 1 TsaB [Smithella sp.]
MLILAFDTSGKSAAVAILRDDVIIYDVIINSGLNHSEVLLPEINQACVQTRLKIADMDLFACTIGPGSFTGLRIGASTLKGLMLATGKPAAGVSSLAALALNIGKTSKKIGSLMDAGRGQVYSAYFRYGQSGFIEQVGEDRILNPADIKNENDEVIYVGDGAVKYADIIRKNHHQDVEMVTATQQFIRASSVAVLGREKYHRHALLDVATFIPVYLRSHDAQVKKSSFDR